jgi:hypothetical protein
MSTPGTARMLWQDGIVFYFTDTTDGSDGFQTTPSPTERTGASLATQINPFHQMSFPSGTYVRNNPSEASDQSVRPRLLTFSRPTSFSFAE